MLRSPKPDTCGPEQVVLCRNPQANCVGGSRAADEVRITRSGGLAFLRSGTVAQTADTAGWLGGTGAPARGLLRWR